MDFSVVKDMYINGYAREAWLNNVKVWSKGVDVDAIMNSLICWYDVKRQGCTNESMSASPVLKDLSGHDYDLNCNGFAWSGMSGVGGYTNFYGIDARANIEVLGEQKWLIKSIIQGNTVNTQCILGYYQQSFNCYDVDIVIRITGALSQSDNTDFIQLGNRQDDNQPIYTHLTEGDNIIHLVSKEEVDSAGAQYVILSFPMDTQNVEVEILPVYPNALVADGVDDYTETIRVFPKDKGTVIAVMQQLEGNISSALLMPSDMEGISNIWYNGLFIGGNSLPGIGFYDTGNRIMINYSEDEIYLKNTSIFTWNNSIPKITINLNNRESKENSIEHRHTKYNFFRDNNANHYAKSALYSFLLFDRTLTTAEIEWVKENLIDGDYPAPIDIDPIAIKNSMVFWFDPKRQGCTNSSMTEDPTMIDLSGNDNNGNCQNFDWVQTNGIGKPDVDFTTWASAHATITDTSESKFTSQMNSTGRGAFAESGNVNLYDDIDRFKVKITGIQEGYPIQMDRGNLDEPTIIIESDGVYDIPGKTGIGRIRFACPKDSATVYATSPVTFEIVPDYDGAIVCNGGCITVNSIEAGTISDYTLIYKRKYVDFQNSIEKMMCLMSNTTGNTNLGLFLVEYKPASATYPYTRSKNGSNYTLTQTDIDTEFNYITNTSYNGTELTAGTNSNENIFNIGAARNLVAFSNAAIYSVILFNRVLNDREIEWVKNNLVEGNYSYE